MEDVSAISLSKRLLRCRSKMLYCSPSRQAHCIHCCCLHKNESKILQSQPPRRVTRLSRNRRGQSLLNFIAELYSSQTKMPFYILTSNPQIIRGNMKNWQVARFGHASKGRNDSRINSEIQGSLSRTE